MKILAFLQNQWVNDPRRCEAILADLDPRGRRAVGAAWLFMGCRTGRVLVRAFGDDEVHEWEWSNASPKLGGRASSSFPPDLDHIRAELEDVRPDVVLAFGRVAADALPKVWTGALITGPHPTARPPVDVPGELARMKHELALAADGIGR